MGRMDLDYLTRNKYGYATIYWMNLALESRYFGRYTDELRKGLDFGKGDCKVGIWDGDRNS